MAVAAPALSASASSQKLAAGVLADQLYCLTNVWSFHLRFTPEQWAAMEPKGGGPFGGPGGPGGPRSPGGPGRWGPAMFLAPIFLKQGDRNQDGKLSQEEFQALAEKWFAGWDKEKTAKLNLDQLRAGLNAAFAPPNFGPPGAGGPGGRGPGMGLQGAEGRRNGLASAMGIEFQYVHADLEFEGQVLKDVAVRYKGNGTFMQSRGSLKRSLKVDLNKFVRGQRLAGVTKLNFHNNVTDASWMNEVMSHRLFRDAGVPAPRTAYARVFVTVPGKHDRQYFGLYSLVENIDRPFEHAQLHAKGGAIFKPVTPDLFGDLGDDWARYRQTYDPKSEISDAEARRVIEFCRLVSHADDATFAQRLGEYLDLDEFARFMAVTVWLATMDSILGPGQNYYVYLHPETHKFQFLPWDLDHSFGQFPMIGSQEQRENLSLQRPWQGEKRFLDRVFKVPAFKQLYLARLGEFSATIFRPERLERQVDEIAAAIRPAVQDESAEKLARFDRVAAGEPVGPAGLGGGPGAVRAEGPRPGRGEGGDGPRFPGPGGFMQPAKPIKGFVVARARSVREQLAGKAEGQTLAGFGFGGPGGPPGLGGPGGGPGRFLAPAFMIALDADQDGRLRRDEFTRGFARWFAVWDSDHDGALSEEELRAGIARELSPFRGDPPDGPEPGGPPDFPPE